MPRILVIDDDARYRRILRLALESLDFEVIEAKDGTALAPLLYPTPDLILLDWHMPGMDGPEVLRKLRLISAAPVIMTSANGSHSRPAALAAGASSYLSKPFALGDLVAGIESALGLSRHI